MKTSKLFHSVVVLGMSLAATAACSDSSTPQTPTGGSTSSGGSSGGSSGSSDADGGLLADAGGDAFAGWSCCG